MASCHWRPNSPKCRRHFHSERRWSPCFGFRQPQLLAVCLWGKPPTRKCSLKHRARWTFNIVMAVNFKCNRSSSSHGHCNRWKIRRKMYEICHLLLCLHFWKFWMSKVGHKAREAACMCLCIPSRKSSVDKPESQECPEFFFSPLSHCTLYALLIHEYAKPPILLMKQN